MDSSIWWETNRSVRRQLPVRWILSSSTGRHFVVLDSEYPCLFRVAWNRNTSTSNHHQSMLLSASRFKFLLLAIVCELQILAHVLLHHLGPSCAAFVLRRKIWTCRRVEEDQWSGYRFQTNFQLLVLAELRYIQRLTEATSKPCLVAIFFSGTYLHLHQLQLPSRKWPSHESHVNLCIRTQKSHKDRDEIRKITNAKLHYFPPVIATILQCWPEGSASEISQGLSLGHLEISSDRRIQNDQSQGLRTNIIYIYIYIILGALLGTLSFKFPFFNWKPYLWAWNPPFLVRPKR